MGWYAEWDVSLCGGVVGGIGLVGWRMLWLMMMVGCVEVANVQFENARLGGGGGGGGW